MGDAWAVVESGVVIESHDADELVPWWSFTKTMMAAAALVLVRDRVTELDAPLPDQPFTLRQLLQHRSGLVNYGGFAAYHEAVARGEKPWPVSVLLQRLEAGRLRYAAGEGWDYSNIGYLFVRQLIETQTGESLDSALRSLVLAPLGITGPRIAQSLSDLDQVAMGRAKTYDPGWVYHGLMVGSVGDAARVLDHLMRPGLLPPDLLAEMRRPHVLPGPVPERPWIVPGYGLGLMIGETSFEEEVVGHTGGGPGSTIAVYHAPKARPPRTVAFFAPNEDQARTEENAFRRSVSRVSAFGG
jgi:CubicO group peptidase (beta-lactamase class C family)